MNRLVILLSALAGLLCAQGALAQAPPAVAQVSYVEGSVEIAAGAGRFAAAAEGASLRIGDRLRTGPAATARIDFAWMSVLVSANSSVSLPASLVLATVLEAGRVEQSSRGGDIIKLLTDEARIRGAGRVVARRLAGVTYVSALQGSFQVEGENEVVTLQQGQGTSVRLGAAPAAPEALPAAPGGLLPGDDPVYVAPNSPVDLSWQAPGPGRYHLEVLGVNSDQVLLSRDLAGPPAQVSLPWVGTFRWRLANAVSGLEGPPSREGLITVFK